VPLIFLERAPLLFNVIKNLSRRGMRGMWRLTKLLERVGYFDGKVVRYEISHGYLVYVPIYLDVHWDRKDLLHYEHDMIETLVRASSAADSPLTIVDCGADVGLISIKLASRLVRVEKIVAFEPSQEAFPILEKNLRGLPFKCEALPMAVSNFTGQGALLSPNYDASPHARFLSPVSEGGFPVATIDSLSLHPSALLIKIDVEGGEIDVVRGGINTIKSAQSVIISVEGHPKVFARTKIDPICVLQEIASVRPFGFTVAETGQSNLDLSRPFFEQVPDPTEIYNIICVSGSS
jgi:FkbM family methyltransferase